MRANREHLPAGLRPYVDFAYLKILQPFAQPFAPAWLEVEPGIKMQLDPYDLVSRAILQSGQWEPESVHAMIDGLSPGATFIDVVAHIGSYSLRAARVVGGGGHVLAIEPNPQTLPVLRGNIAASNARAVRVWPVACAEADSTLLLYAAPRANSGESSLSKQNASQEGLATASCSVPARPLDAIVQEAQLNRVDVMKIHVEGAEFAVLKGAAQTLDRYRPVLILELVPYQLKAMGTSVEEVTRFLVAHGYKAKRRLDEDNFEFAPVQ